MKTFIFLFLAIFGSGELINAQKPGSVNIKVFPDSVINDVSNHPIGINLDYFMDDDNYLKPKRRTADALKEMGVKYLRYPGGNKSDFYFFSKPPYERSEPTLARTGPNATGGRGKMLKNFNEFKFDVLDFDEFISMCHEIGAEPVVVVAADEYLNDYAVGNLSSTRKQLISHAVEWVRYSNIKKNYNVKYWMIGNETWMKGENENSTAEIYAHDVVDFSIAMKAIDPTIKIIPNGDSDSFWKSVLTIAAGNIDLLCLSNYPYSYKAGYASYRDTVKNLVRPVKIAIKAIEKYATPADKEKLKIIVAEYGPFYLFQMGKWPFINNMGNALANFEITGDLLLEPKVEFSCFWNTRWIDNDKEEHALYDALDRNGNFNANGYGMMIWGKFLGDKMVKTTSPNVNVRTFSSFVPQEKKLFLYLINTSDIPKEIVLKIQGYTVKSINQVWELTGNGPDDSNPVWGKVTGINISKPQILKGTSIRVIECFLK